MELVPSSGWETGLNALDYPLEGKRSASAAIAFVSRSGAEALCRLIDRHSSVEYVYIVARGAPITDPNALLKLKETLGASNSSDPWVGRESVPSKLLDPRSRLRRPFAGIAPDSRVWAIGRTLVSDIVPTPVG